MLHAENSNQTQPEFSHIAQKPSRTRGCTTRLIVSLLGLTLLLLAFNFGNFHLAQSQTKTDLSLGTSRSGNTMPANMRPGFSLNYAVAGAGENTLATAVSEALAMSLTDNTLVDRATAVDDPNAAATARLYVELDTTQRLWTPFYGRAHITATVYAASHANVPWPEDVPMAHKHSPEIQALGDFTIVDTSWGLLSKPAYTDMIADALAQAIADGLQQDVWQRP